MVFHLNSCPGVLCRRGSRPGVIPRLHLACMPQVSPCRCAVGCVRQLGGSPGREKEAPASPAGFHRSSRDAADFPASTPSGGHRPAAKLGARQFAGTGLFFAAGKSTEIYRMTTCLWRISGSYMSE